MHGLFVRCVLVCGIFCLFAHSAYSAPYLSKGTSIKGALAYQDDQDPTQFWYQPLSAQSTIPDRLKTFKASYFGVGKAFLVQQSDGSITSKAGAILSGTVNIDISDVQRQQLIMQITKDFGIANPKLLPLRLSNTQIQTTVLDKIVGFGDSVQQIFPSSFQIGSDFAFSVGSLNSGFAQVVGNLAQAPDATVIVSNPQFGMNVTAQAEFVGDPWSADIDCDLSQVWSQVRSSAGVTASFGWFRIGNAQYSSIAQALQKSGACSFNMKEGSLDTAKYGRQVLEMTKQMFEAINTAASTGQGYFQFQPNPEAPAPGGGGGLSLFGWSISINASYSSASFTQGIRWHTSVSYSGRANYPVALGTALAVSCSPSTQQYFEDLEDASQPCITQTKIDLLQNRLAAEAKAKLPLYTDLNSKLAAGTITLANYQQVKSAIDQLVITDTTYVLASKPLVGVLGLQMKTIVPASSFQTIYALDLKSGKLVATKISSERLKVISPIETLKAAEMNLAK